MGGGLFSNRVYQEMSQKGERHIEKQTQNYAKHNNQMRKKLVFMEEGWVWLHLRKERFPSQRQSKLSLREDGSFQVLQKINDNVYKLYLPPEY